MCAEMDEALSSRQRRFGGSVAGVRHRCENGFRLPCEKVLPAGRTQAGRARFPAARAGAGKGISPRGTARL